MKTPEQKIKLISRLADWFYNNTNTWETRLGSQLAYLFAAIARDHKYDAYGDEEIILLLQDTTLPQPISKDDEVWDYIEFAPED